MVNSCPFSSAVISAPCAAASAISATGWPSACRQRPAAASFVTGAHGVEHPGVFLAGFDIFVHCGAGSAVKIKVAAALIVEFAGFALRGNLVPEPLPFAINFRKHALRRRKTLANAVPLTELLCFAVQRRRIELRSGQVNALARKVIFTVHPQQPEPPAVVVGELLCHFRIGFSTARNCRGRTASAHSLKGARAPPCQWWFPLCRAWLSPARGCTCTRSAGNENIRCSCE